MFFDNGMNGTTPCAMTCITSTAAARWLTRRQQNGRHGCETAVPGVPQQGAKTFEPREGLKITPYAGVNCVTRWKAAIRSAMPETLTWHEQRQRNGGGQHRRAETGLPGKGGWSANATLEGGPNLSYARASARQALQGQAASTLTSIRSEGRRYQQPGERRREVQ